MPCKHTVRLLHAIYSALLVAHYWRMHELREFGLITHHISEPDDSMVAHK